MRMIIRPNSWYREYFLPFRLICCSMSYLTWGLFFLLLWVWCLICSTICSNDFSIWSMSVLTVNLKTKVGKKCPLCFYYQVHFSHRLWSSKFQTLAGFPFMSLQAVFPFQVLYRALELGRKLPACQWLPMFLSTWVTAESFFRVPSCPPWTWKNTSWCFL